MSIKIMSQVWDDARTTDAREMLALLALADWSDEWGGSYPSYATLASKIRVKKRQTAIDVVSHLIEKGEVFKPGKVGDLKSNLFVLLAGTRTSTDMRERITKAIEARGGKPPKDIDKRVAELLKIRFSTSPPQRTSTPQSTSEDSTPQGTSHSPLQSTSLVPHSVPNTLSIRQDDTLNGGGIDPAPPSTPLSAPDIAAAVLKDLETAQRQRGMEVQANETAILGAFQRFNESIKKSDKGFTPITGTGKIARDLALRGETEATMKAAWDTCKANAIKPMGAFMKWIQEGYLPPQQEGHETKTVDGVVHVWTDDNGWVSTGRKAV